MNEATDMGPMINEGEAKRLESGCREAEQARRHGADRRRPHAAR